MAGELPITHIPVFESLGESQVRMQFVKYSDDIAVQAREWLLLKEQERLEVVVAKRDAREEETVSIARSALRNAKRANFIAICAALLAAGATVFVAFLGFLYSAPK